MFLTSFDISGSILIFFSDSSKTLIALTHYARLFLTYAGWISLINYFIEPLFKLVDIGSELEGLEFELFETFGHEEVEDLFWNKISQVSDNELEIGVDSFSQFEN